MGNNIWKVMVWQVLAYLRGRCVCSNFTCLLSAVLLLTLLLESRCAHAGDWSRADTARESAYELVQAADWAQTREVARNPEKYYETNRVLGHHPSVDSVDAYFITASLLHPLVSYWLPPGYRTAWQYVSIGLEFSVVKNNYGIGLGVRF